VTAPAPRLPWSGPYLFTSAAGRRPYFVHTPIRHEIGTPAPLVVVLHGCSQTPRGIAISTQWNDLADEHGFVVVYPGQTLAVERDAVVGQPQDPDPSWQDGNGDHCWNWFLPGHQRRDAGEPAIIAGITGAVVADTGRWTIDPTRVYMAGMSAGGAMAVILGATYPELYAAIGVHSGLEYEAATDVVSAFQVLAGGGPDPVDRGRRAYRAMGEHARVVPAFVVQGTLDLRVNPVNGDQVVSQWLETNRLASGGAVSADFAAPTTDTRFPEPVPGGHPYRVRAWTDDRGRTIQEYWTVDGMGHAWSGGYWLGSFADPRGPSATRAMYSFFSRT
jgi:poly(hydroxyalkanoate) depolymerase family esterase